MIMAQPHHSQKWQQTSYDGSGTSLSANYDNRQEAASSASAGATTYGTVNVSGNAHAVLGDVNISTSDLTFLQAANPQYQRRMLLKALYFEGMSTRKAQIDARASSPKYVEWIWRTNFPAWLAGPDSFYWVTGRPGSGKSSLMTHISSSARTKQILARRGDQWKVVHFFFDFRAGQSLANNITGLLRSLLHQIVQQVPELVNRIDPDLMYGSSESETLQKCLDALCDAFEVSSYHICVFIDGLDEFEGSYADLIDTIQQIGERVLNIKICLASRPYLPFRDSLGEFAGITMQDHNDESIKLYTSAQWSNHRIDHRAELPRDLSNQIRVKAKGVFLWARLAVDELIVDMIAGKSISELYQQIEQMPAEVEAMYQRILERLSEPHQQEAAAILYMILQTDEPLPIDKIYAALQALKAHGSAAQMVLPISCDTDNSHRILAILGDLIDQDFTLEDDVPHRSGRVYLDPVPLRLMMEGSTIRCNRQRMMHVSLTHETLRSFLAKSSWLAAKVHPCMAANIQHCFWIDLYLTEISIHMLSGESHKICDPVLEYQSKVMGIQAELPGDRYHEVALMKLLQLWPDWTPFSCLRWKSYRVRYPALDLNGYTWSIEFCQYASL